MLAAAIKNSVIVGLIVLISHFLLRQALTDRQSAQALQALHSLQAPAKVDDVDASSSSSLDSESDVDKKTVKGRKNGQGVKKRQHRDNEKDDAICNDATIEKPPNPYRRTPSSRNPKEEELYRFVFASEPGNESAAPPLSLTNAVGVPSSDTLTNLSLDNSVLGGLQAFSVDGFSDYCAYTAA